MQQRFLLDTIAAVPVGHRVRIEVYEANEPGKRFEHQRTPEVTDLDTGIRWVAASLHAKDPTNSWFDSWQWRDDVDPAYATPKRTWEGRVAACAVATNAKREGYATMLLVDVDDPATPYRG